MSLPFTSRNDLLPAVYRDGRNGASLSPAPANFSTRGSLIVLDGSRGNFCQRLPWTYCWNAWQISPVDPHRALCPHA
jgi:hypothetical protein